NLGTDSINDVITRINKSSAGVQARFDGTTDSLVLTNTRTGDTGINAIESPGGLLGALGLTAGSTLTRGTDAQFTLNDGTILTSPSNGCDASVHGVVGRSLTAQQVGSTTSSVANDTEGVQKAIETITARYNDIQAYIDHQ